MKILVVRNDKLGDFITALPSLYILKKYLPHARIAVLIAPMNASIAHACDFIDEVILDEKQSTWALATMLRTNRFDLSFTLFSNTRVALAQFLARIPNRIAPATKIAQIFYTHRITQRRSQVKMAEFEYNMQLIKTYFSDIELEYPKPLLLVEKSSVKQPTVAFHCGFGGSSDANWTVAEYIELARMIEVFPVKILFTFGPGDELFLENFKRLKGNLQCEVFVSKGTVLDFAKVVANFALFVSTSTGTYHIASLVGTPTMTFFADTLFASAKRWKSIGDETIQHNYMIPLEPQARTALFEKVKIDLHHFIKGHL